MHAIVQQLNINEICTITLNYKEVKILILFGTQE